MELGMAIAQLAERRNCDREVADSTQMPVEKISVVSLSKVLNPARPS